MSENFWVRIIIAGLILSISGGISLWILIEYWKELK